MAGRRTKADLQRLNMNAMQYDTDSGYDPTLNQACQMSHFFVGIGIMAIVVGTWFQTTAGFWSYLIGAAFVAGWAAVKEYAWDTLGPEKDAWGWPGSTEDFIFYLIGGTAGAAIMFILHWWGGT